jgi:N-acetylneuraminate lyase
MNLYDIERIKHAFPDKIIFNGFDEIFFFSLNAGADAAIGTTVNIFPKLFIAIREEFKKGNISGGRDLQQKLNDFIEVIVSAGVFPAAKFSLTIQGIDTGPCRKPFAPLSEEGKKQVKGALKKLEAWL